MMARFDEIDGPLASSSGSCSVNYLGCVYPTHYALPASQEEPRARSWCMASLAGLTGVPTRTGYAASKHAVFGFFDSLRIELEGYRRVA